MYILYSYGDPLGEVVELPGLLPAGICKGSQQVSDLKAWCLGSLASSHLRQACTQMASFTQGLLALRAPKSLGGQSPSKRHGQTVGILHPVIRSRAGESPRSLGSAGPSCEPRLQIAEQGLEAVGGAQVRESDSSVMTSKLLADPIRRPKPR